MKTAVTACMRNEGPYILEWAAYHRVIGFDRVIIASNDCTDGSAHLMDLMHQRGHIVHLHNHVHKGHAPQQSGMWKVFDNLRNSDIMWLCHIDSDEFVNIGAGQGRVQDLLRKAGEADVIALPWLAFGDSGHAHRTLPVLPNFTACEGKPVEDRVKFKSMFRHSVFHHANDHMPTGCQIEDPLVLGANGARLNNNVLFADKRAKYRPFDKSIKPRAACINHYGVKSTDDFLMKNDRGDGQGKTTDKYYLGSRWHQIANQNDHQDKRILRHWRATEALMNDWRSDPEIAAAEQACLEWDTARRAEVLTPANRRKWTKGVSA